MRPVSDARSGSRSVRQAVFILSAIQCTWMWTDKPLTSITLGNLQQLVTDKVRENRQLDYKDEQPAHPQANNDKKSEFAVDISALANGSGGLLIYGVAEEKENNRPTGIASALNGLAGFNLDADGNHLRNYLETALDPKLPTGLVELHTIDGGSSGPLLLVRVRKSYSGPHMVRAEGRFRNSFYIRDGARNRQLDAKGILFASDASALLQSAHVRGTTPAAVPVASRAPTFIHTVSKIEPHETRPPILPWNLRPVNGHKGPGGHETVIQSCLQAVRRRSGGRQSVDANALLRTDRRSMQCGYCGLFPCRFTAWASGAA